MARRWQMMTRKEQVRLQLARLRQFLEQQVIPFHPYYREIWTAFRRNPLSPVSPPR